MAYPSDLVRTKTWGSEVLTSSDLHTQYDLIINWVMAALNATTGHSHDGSANNGPKIPITNLTVSSQAQGDTITATSASAWGRIAKGSANQLYQMNAGATSPEWVNYSTFVTSSNALAGSVVQTVNTLSGSVATGSTVMPFDDSIPQNTEGDQYMTLAITPTSATNKLKITVVVNGGHGATGAHKICAGLFQDSTAGALAAGYSTLADSSSVGQISFVHYMTSGTTSSTTFKVRAGGADAGTFTFNGYSSGRIFGGIIASSITIQEIKV